MTRSQLVREGLEIAMHSPKPWPASWLELARDFAGCIKGGPEDLATNPKYMDGVGE
jgi:hypothetical protein